MSVVDINFGCPVRDVTEKAHSGSYLLRYPERVGAIVAKVVQACADARDRQDPPGLHADEIRAIEVAQVVEAAGAAALTVHGRVAQDFFRGQADWDQIAAIKPHLKRIPLIGNGDLDSADKVLDALRHYRVDGVMIARAALGRPWLFRQVQAALRGEPVPPEPTLDEQREVLLRHYRLVLRTVRRREGDDADAQVRLLLCPGPARRSALPHVHRHVETPEEFYAVVERHFPRERQGRSRTHGQADAGVLRVACPRVYGSEPRVRSSNSTIRGERLQLSGDVSSPRKVEFERRPQRRRLFCRPAYLRGLAARSLVLVQVIADGSQGGHAKASQAVDRLAVLHRKRVARCWPIACSVWAARTGTMRQVGTSWRCSAARPGLSAQLATVEPSQVLDHLSDCRRLILVDACRGNQPPGTVIRPPGRMRCCRSQRRRSSHALGCGRRTRAGRNARLAAPSGRRLGRRGFAV